ncbi:hypothetical protein HZS_5737 [Henneguya salminicola]|nr:hypothetical protein HZS_5737 [Henneguya salminicola]
MSAIGIDFGNYSSYVALVRTGGIDTVDNDYSYRATPTAVAFTNLLRFTGNSAKIQAVTNYRNTFCSFKNLIGLMYDEPRAQLEMSLIPSNFIKLDDGTIGVEATYLNQPCQFSITQLTAMMLSELKKTTLRHVSAMTATVLSVPSFFTEIQRRYFLDACDIAGLVNFNIINDTAAVCLNYILFKTDLPADNKVPRYVAFVDVGYSSTQICIASFTKSKVRVISSIGTNSIGGRQLDRLLCDKFCAEFKQKYKKDVPSNSKSYLKLLAECESFKKQMNTTVAELPIKIECFMEDMDLISKSSQEELDFLASNIYQNFENLLLSGLKESALKTSDIHSVEIIGGTSRVRGLRKIIASVFQKEPSCTLNSDEAVSRGCAIQCAILSPVIKIREIELKDILSSQFTINYMGKNGNKDLDIFKSGDVIPSIKEIIFPPKDNFSFSIYQTSFGETNLVATCTATGKSASECKADSLIFYRNVDLSGILSISKGFFLERRKQDEPQEVESKEPPVESKTDESTTKSIRVIHDLQVNLVYVRDNSNKISKYKQIEADMLRQVAIERERSTAKNTLEEYIYSTKDKMESIYREYITSTEAQSLSQVLSQEENWLYSEGESETTMVYTQHFMELQNLVLPYQSRYEGFTQSFASLDKTLISLAHYRKFMDIYNRDPAQYDYISETEYNEYAQKVAQTDSFVNESYNKLQNQPKTQLPCVASSDIESVFANLCWVCDKILKKVENPPPKPQPPSDAQPDLSTEQSSEPQADGTETVTTQ